MAAKGWRKRQIMDDKKILMKIRLRPDGTWEHVYDDGSVDQEFYQMTPYELANINNITETEHERLKRQRNEKMIAYHSLRLLQEELIEMALDKSELREAKSVLTHIMSKK